MNICISVKFMATKPIFVVDNGAYMSKSNMNTIDKLRLELF
jgi:hypothetical protein